MVGMTNLSVPTKNPRKQKASQVFENAKKHIFDILTKYYDGLKEGENVELRKHLRENHTELMSGGQRPLTQEIIEEFEKMLIHKKEKLKEQKHKKDIEEGDRYVPRDDQDPEQFVWAVMEQDGYDPTWSLGIIKSIFKQAYPVFCEKYNKDDDFRVTVLEDWIRSWKSTREPIWKVERARGYMLKRPESQTTTAETTADTTAQPQKSATISFSVTSN